MKAYKKILLTIFILILILFLLRLTTPKEIDDVNPWINCEQNYIKKANILWVIPTYKNIPITENKSWCKEILNLNKTLGMHGIYHSYHEFENEINESSLNDAILIFEECFNQTPENFKPPQLKISKENKKILSKHNLNIRNPFDQTIHKVYHCSNTGRLPNWFHDIF